MARLPEQRVNDALRRELEKHWLPSQFLLQRIESNTAPGIPDFYLQSPKGSCWIESKAGTQLSNDQINWHLRHARAGGHSYLLTRSCRPIAARRDALSNALGATPTLYLLICSLQALPNINAQMKNPAEAGLTVEEWCSQTLASNASPS